MTMADLAEYQARMGRTNLNDYHGWRVSELPPNGQGIAVLAMLNIMEQFPSSKWGPNSAQVASHDDRSEETAYADLLRYVGDPRFSKMPSPR